MKLQFDVAGSDLASVKASSFKYYLDGNTTAKDLSNVVVTENDGYFTATADMPAEAIESVVVKDGVQSIVKSHTIEVTVADKNGESVKSSKFTVETDKVLPAPVNVRVVGAIVIPPVIKPVKP